MEVNEANVGDNDKVFNAYTDNSESDNSDKRFNSQAEGQVRSAPDYLKQFRLLRSQLIGHRGR